MRSQYVAAVLSLVCFVLGAAIALTASHGVSHHWWSYQSGLEIAAPGFLLGLVGAGAGGLWLARALNLNDSAGWKSGALGLAGSLLLIFFPLNQLRLYLVSPPIHDISTDPEYPPPFVALLPLRAGAPNGPEYDGMKLVTYGGKRTHVAAAQKKAYPDIKPARLLSKPSVIFWRAFERAKDMGWNVVYFSEKDGRIEATHTSFWFGRVADISIRVMPAGRIGARLDIRAKSRSGESDMGASAALVMAYLKAIEGK
ncbi:MAG: DUF1499 domain-containing protein [Rhizomicrobium sp.]